MSPPTQLNDCHWLDIASLNAFEETVYPVLEAKRAHGGRLMFTVSPSGKSTDTRGATQEEVLQMLVDGSFARGAKIRMSPRQPGARGKSSGFRVRDQDLSAPLLAWVAKQQQGR